MRNSLNIQMKEIFAYVWKYSLTLFCFWEQNDAPAYWGEGVKWRGGVVLALQNEFTEIFIYNFFEGFCWEGMSFILTFLQMSSLSNTRSGRTKGNYTNNNKTKQKLNHFWFALTLGDQLGSLCFTIVCLELNGTHRRCVESAKKKISRLPTTFRVTKKSLIHSDMLLLVLHTDEVKNNLWIRLS